MAAGATISAQTSPAVAWLVIVDDLHLDFRATGELRTFIRAVADELIRTGGSRWHSFKRPFGPAA
jgi:hypothetical protein